MKKAKDNPPILSCKTRCQGQTDYGRELRTLRADLEAERHRSQRTHQYLRVELKLLCEEAERELQKALLKLVSQPGYQTDRHLNKSWLLLTDKVNFKGTRQYRKENLCSSVGYTRLEQLLTLFDKINIETACYKLHSRQELDLEKALLLCHLLKTQEKFLPQRQEEAKTSKVTKRESISKKTQHIGQSDRHLTYSKTLLKTTEIYFKSLKKRHDHKQQQHSSGRVSCAADPYTAATEGDTCPSSSLKICHPHSAPHVGWDDPAFCCTDSSGSDRSSPSKCMERNMEFQPKLAHKEMDGRKEAEGPQQDEKYSEENSGDHHGVTDKLVPATSLLGKRHHSLYASLNGYEGEAMRKNGTDYSFLVRQNSELLRALDELEKTCTTLREENGLLRKSSAPETEEKVRRLRRKNTELAVLAKRLEDRARKLQEANLRVVNPPLVRPGSVDQYKRAFARQRARDLAHHADALLCKDKEIAALQQECRELEAQLGTAKGSPVPCGGAEFEKLLRESQKEVLRLQRQLSVTSQYHSNLIPNDTDNRGGTEKGDHEKKVAGETPCVPLDEVLSRCEKTPREEEESGQCVTPAPGLSPTPSQKEEHPDHLHFLESELSKKRKECENLEHEVKKRQRRCLDLESRLEEERGKNEELKEEADLLRRKAQLLDQTRAENEELREDLSEVTAQHNLVLEENQRLRAKLENLEQVLKHMREVAERRQQLELEHEQALAILKFKQDEIKRLQRAQLFAKREHEGVVQMLESKVRDLEDKCRSQSAQFGLLSQELENFRMQASKVDLAASSLHNNPSLSVLTNGLGLTADRDCSGSLDMVSLGEIAFWSLEGGDPLSGPEGNDPLDVAAALRIGVTPHAAGLSRVERSPVTKHRELPTISVSKSASNSIKSEATPLTPKSDTHLSPHKTSSTHEVDTASEVEELDIDVAPASYTVNRVASKLHVFIARYSYNPYDGPNDNPDVELPLTAGEYIYVYGDMDEDGFYEGELMDGRRGLVPSNFVERVSDDDVMGGHHPETVDLSHHSLLDSSLHSASHQHHLHTRTESSTASGPASAASHSASALAVPAPLTNGLDLDLEEVGVDVVPYPRKLTLIKQLAKSIIIGWDPPSVPAGWGNIWSYNVYVDQELRVNVPFGSQTKAVLERLDINLKAYRVSVQSLTEKGLSDQLRCSMLVGRDVSVAPTQLNIDRVTATTANLSWLPSNSNYVHIVSLNGEEYELVKAGCYSLCLTNLSPSLQYTVKVEARPHRTPWELPVERREHRTTTVTFKTLMAGPPDAPLDIQLEQGPSPGIALISWLPVTIDAVGTSNGVRVTGYSIYADKKKVLEVSSPTAGSALLGPSQIQSLQGAQELTVRSMSAHGESCDSLPVSLTSKLDDIITGSSVTSPVPASPCIPLCPSNLTSPVSYGNPAAKVSMLPSTLPPNTPSTSQIVEHSASLPNTLLLEDSSALYVNAWANPSSAAALTMGDSVLPAASNITPLVRVTSPITTMPQILLAPTQGPVMLSAMLEQRRDTDSPGLIRPFPSITEFIEDPCAKLERIPSPPKAPTTDLLSPQDSRLLRPPSTSPLDSEVEDEQENTRLVSIEEFLKQDQQSTYSKRQQPYGKGLVEPPSEYHADNSRSDLSDILEEEEEDLSSDHLGETQTMRYIAAVNRLKSCKVDTPDSDEEVLEKILKLPPQVYNTKQLSSIPEMTEVEDSCLEEPLSYCTHPRTRPSHHAPKDPRLQPAAQHLSKAHAQLPVSPMQHHLNVDVRTATKELIPRQAALQVRPKTQLRVHYADPLDISFPEEDTSVYEAPSSRRASARCPPQPNPHGRALLKGLGDRLRREAMLRSQMAAAATGNPSHDLTPPIPFPVSKSVHTVRSPMSRAVEIDVEYGTDNEEPAECGGGEVVMEHMSSEWWVEGAQKGTGRQPRRHGLKPQPLANLTASQQRWEPSQVPPAEAGSSWRGQAEDLKSMHTRQPKGCFEFPKMTGSCDMRIFVALFPYDPATMSPNPGAAEEELPFSEGQIIKVYGDKDADGFYQGECAGQVGLVPCNMVSEIQVEDEETRQQLLQQGFLSTVGSMDKIGTCTHAQLPRRAVPPPKPRRSKKVESASLWDSPSQDPSKATAVTSAEAGAVGGTPAVAPISLPNPVPENRKMVAIFDYDPRESSPNTDVEAELTFSAGDIIHVFGDMDEDGFFYGELNGQRGLVPSNFLQALPEADSAPPHPQEPKRESQAAWRCSQHDLESPATHEALCTEVEAACPEEPTEILCETAPEVLPSVTAGSDQALAPGAAEVKEACPDPTESTLPGDSTTQAKKKKGFFSKGKRLFKKLGSSKKE